MDRYIIEADYGRGFEYPRWDGMEIAESEERAVQQVLALVDEAEAIRVTRFNDEVPARDWTEDVLWLAFLDWHVTHDMEHTVPSPLQSQYDTSNIHRMAG